MEVVSRSWPSLLVLTTQLCFGCGVASNTGAAVSPSTSTEANDAIGPPPSIE